MRMVVLVLAGWTGMTAVAGGLFVAVIRGGGGTDLAPLPDEAPAVAMTAVALPQQRAAAEDRTRTNA